MGITLIIVLLNELLVVIFFRSLPVALEKDTENPREKGRPFKIHLLYW